ncbi:MAG: carbon-nitrogen hydrolase family protein [Solirubrobacterales bacterium]|nr:carbon-nitrogen hydrolase family protein [Solirubrobacterales bacterium]
MSARPYTFAAVAGSFGGRFERSFARVSSAIESARDGGASMVVLPECALGGYLTVDGRHGRPLELDGPELARLCAVAGDTVVCVGFTERGGRFGRPYSSAVCLSGDGILGHQRKVHLPPSEIGAFSAGEGFAAFDTPVGRLGMLVCYDKVFPEAARTLALDGAETIASLSAWPLDRRSPARRIAADRQTRHFNLLDEARALENQVVWISSNLTGRIGPLRFPGQAKVVDPDGNVLAQTGGRPGTATAEVALGPAIAASRAAISHLDDRARAAYRIDRPAPAPPAAEPARAPVSRRATVELPAPGAAAGRLPGAPAPGLA